MRFEPNKHLHSKEHVLADDISTMLSEPKRFAAYLGISRIYMFGFVFLVGGCIGPRSRSKRNVLSFVQSDFYPCAELSKLVYDFRFFNIRSAY